MSFVHYKPETSTISHKFSEHVCNIHMDYEIFFCWMWNSNTPDVWSVEMCTLGVWPVECGNVFCISIYLMEVMYGFKPRLWSILRQNSVRFFPDTHIYIHTHTYIYTYIHIHVYTYTYIRIYIFMFIYIYIYVYMSSAFLFIAGR